MVPSPSELVAKLIPLKVVDLKRDKARHAQENLWKCLADRVKEIVKPAIQALNS